MDVLAPDVVLISDGGGRVATARRPIVGADKLLKYNAAGFTRLPAELTGTPIWLNGAPGALLAIGGETTAAITMTVENGRITRIYGVWNPDKLRWLEKPADLRR